MAEYVWRPGARISGVTAEAALAELTRIAAEHEDRLLPDDVLEEARPETASLHPAFEWDDKKAAEGYRLDQARHIVRSVRIVEVEDSRKVDRPAFVYVPPAEPSGTGAYRAPEVVIRHEDEWARVVRQAEMYISSAQRALDDLKGIAAGSDAPARITDITVALEAIKVAREAIAALRAA